MTLCEAYGMTNDPKLREPAHKAVEFIVKAQNSVDGGWRYNPAETGDTCVFGWQLFALRSAFLAGLEVPERTLRGANSYLDKAAADPIRTTYFYRPGDGKPNKAMDAEALLSRQYLGWPRNHHALNVGAQPIAANLLDDSKQSNRNVYYWYYAPPSSCTICKGRPG